MYTTIGPLQLQTFTFALALAIIAGAGVGILRTDGPRGALVDVCLGALVGGIIGARVGHVLLNWTYFSYNANEIMRIRSGGLDWHGALLGGLAGLWIVTRWHRVSATALLDSLAPALALLAMAGWWGCGTSNCGFGAQVDTLANYPPLVVAELPDVYGIPAARYNTPLFGVGMGLLVLLLTLAPFWRGWLTGRRFWLVLALLSAGMFAIGFLRADYALMVADLRADQWLDGAVLAFSLLMLARRPGLQATNQRCKNVTPIW